MITIALADVLDSTGITRNALAREAKVRPPLIYDMYAGKTQRIDLDTLYTIIYTLRHTFGLDVNLADILRYEEVDGNETKTSEEPGV